ncbi:MAG: threonine/serine exporter family protein [Acetobacter sp.]|nr:threonine/serine exporter family protein [Bacteroides sp.]MCM1341575.1 threonine/serine exporter family protein [Acetobacter sp.]MCM1433652.1 threonine/serine exporter family protein [Clostridiales bacterium]
METVKQIILCVTGTLAFAITMQAPKKSMYLITIGGLITASTERFITKEYNDFIACGTAMLFLFIYCEITSRITKQPTTVILIPSTIPLLPGSAIYYTMLYAIQGNKELMVNYAKSTLLAGLGIALGAVIGTTLAKIFSFKN